MPRRTQKNNFLAVLFLPLCAMMTMLRTLVRMLPPLLLFAGITSAEPDALPRQPSPPPPGDPRAAWNAHVADCEKESRP